MVRPLSSISRMYSIIRLQKPARHVRKLAPSKTTKLRTKKAAPTPTETCSSFFWTTARHIEAAASSALSNIWKNQFNSRLPYDYTYTTNFSEKTYVDSIGLYMTMSTEATVCPQWPDRCCLCLTKQCGVVLTGLTSIVFDVAFIISCAYTLFEPSIWNTGKMPLCFACCYFATVQESVA